MMKTLGYFNENSELYRLDKSHLNIITNTIMQFIVNESNRTFEVEKMKKVSFKNDFARFCRILQKNARFCKKR